MLATEVSQASKNALEVVVVKKLRFRSRTLPPPGAVKPKPSPQPRASADATLDSGRSLQRAERLGHKALGTLAGDERAPLVLAHSSYGILGSRVQRGKKKRSRNQVEKSAPEAQGTTRSNARVGLELTFKSSESEKYVTNIGFPIAGRSEAKRWWKRMLAEWTKGMEPSDVPWDVDIMDAGKNKDMGGGTGEMEIKRVVFTDRDGDGKVKFWWQLSMDPGVVEIQTYPVTGDEMKNEPIRSILGAIYERASALGFEPGGGGGHVNVDFKTGFGEDYGLIPRIILATDYLIRDLEKASTDDPARGLVDFENMGEDPSVSTERYKMRLNPRGGWDTSWDPKKKKSSDHSGGWKEDVFVKKGLAVKDYKSLEIFRDHHAKWLLKHPSVAQYNKSSLHDAKITGKGDKEGLNEVLHYQAVNIDHLFSETEVGEEDPRRVEFRFFAGQESVEAIVASIELIGKIIDKARRLEAGE